MCSRPASPTFLAQGINFMEDNFFTDQGWERDGFRMVRHITFIAHFISITSTSPQIIRHLISETGEPCTRLTLTTKSQHMGSNLAHPGLGCCLEDTLWPPCHAPSLSDFGIRGSIGVVASSPLFLRAATETQGTQGSCCLYSDQKAESLYFT